MLDTALFGTARLQSIQLCDLRRGVGRDKFAQGRHGAGENAKLVESNPAL